MKVLLPPNSGGTITYRNEIRSTKMGNIFLCLFCFWMLAAWLTHVITCLAAGTWGFLVAGALVAPIGVIHGTGIWFGAW